MEAYIVRAYVYWLVTQPYLHQTLRMPMQVS